MRKNSAMPWWGWLAWVLAVVLGMVAYHHLPALVATHYDLAGKADRMGSRLQAVLVEPATMLGMILLLANVLPRIQPNWWVGIRTPWTLSSATNWNRTHRLVGHLGIPTGILMVILAWVLPKSMISLAVLVPILLWALIAVVASYVYGRQEEH